jgi:hypothetical protein
LPEDYLRRLGLSEVTYSGATAIRIAYRDENGAEGPVRFRTALEKGAEGDNRFRWRTGSKAMLYGLWRLGAAREKGYVVLVEGESDCHTLWRHEEPALGVPGAATWQEPWAAHLDGIPLIYVLVEPEKSGEAMLQWLSSSVIRDRARLVILDGAKDPSELHVKDPVRFAEQWRTALAGAVPWVDKDARERGARRASAWERCSSLAKLPDILGAFAESLARSGVVGEDVAGKLVYLAFTSRLDARPVSAVMKGPSAGGKSHLVQRVAEHFPPEAYYARTGMSERALAYGQESLKHRILIVYEAGGLQGEMGSYLLRSLLSEHRISYEFPEKTSQGMRLRHIEREGPTGCLLTTTAPRLDAELETRLLNIPVNDTRAQTSAILAEQARQAEDGSDREASDLEGWRALQEWLGLDTAPVVIPYAKALAAKVPGVAVRLRRDFPTLLSLIRAQARLHQATRDRDAAGRILATVADFATVRDLVSDLMSAGVQATVPTAVRETVNAVAAVAGGTGATATVVAKRLRLNKASASRRLWVAEEAGYVQNDEEREGRPGRWRVGEAMPDEQPILPEPATLLDGCTVACIRDEKSHLPPRSSATMEAACA